MNEQDSGVEVVHGCLTEGGDTILGAFFCEATRHVQLQVTSFLANESHDLPGYARASAREPTTLSRAIIIFRTQIRVIKNISVMFHARI